MDVVLVDQWGWWWWSEPQQHISHPILPGCILYCIDKVEGPQ